MNCDRARRTFYDNPGAVERILLRLHLLRCPACRAEAKQIRALDAALSDLPRFTPSPELLPTLLAKARVAPRKETRPMRRLAYALAFLIVIGILSAGLMMKPDQPDGRSLLISAAEAMGLADTVHAIAYGSIVGYYPAMPINDGYDEYWYSPDGFRWDSHHEDGTLWRRLAGNVAQGVVWMELPTRGVSIEYHVAPSDLAVFVQQSRKQFVDADLRLAQIEERGHECTVWEQERDGRPVIVIEEDLGLDRVDGAPRGTVEYYIDPSTKQLISLEQYGPEAEGYPLLAEIENIEYGLDIPASTFAPAMAAPEQVVEGTFEVRDDGYIVFHGMQWAPNYDPRANTLFDRAREVRHWVTMSVLPWEDLENAYLAVLKEDRDHHMAREHLGRFYTRWGLHEEALSLLPDDDSGWTGLNRAFCLDALGRREDALAIYDGLKDYGHDSIAAWAQLGMQQPTWPTDLPIDPEPGEMRFTPVSSWHASASRSAFHGEPQYALDGDRATRWANGGDPDGDAGQVSGQWFILDFGAPQLLNRVVLDHHGVYTIYTNDWPRAVRATATVDGEAWFPVAASPAGPNQPVTVRFDPPQLIKAIRFELTEPHSPEWWSIHEIFVFGSSH